MWKISLQLLPILVAATVAVFVLRRFHPILLPSVEASPVAGDPGSVILTLRVANVGKTTVRIRRAQLQVLEHATSDITKLSEWVPFCRGMVREPPVEWREPMCVLDTTSRIDPGGSVEVDILCHCRTDCYVHVGLQIEASLDWIGRIGTWFRLTTEQWTTTTIVPPRHTRAESARGYSVGSNPYS